MTAPPVSVMQFLRNGWLGSVGPGVPYALVHDWWGEPTQIRLTRPPSRSYGPVTIFLRDGVVTHSGIYLARRNAPGPPGFVLDVGFQSVDDFNRSIEQAGLHAEQVADDAEDDGESLFRIRESGVLVVFDAEGRLSHGVSPEP